jgi:hypothetical protein
MGRSLNGFVTLSSINFNYFGLEGETDRKQLNCDAKRNWKQIHLC